MDNAKNIIEKEFSTVALVEREEPDACNIVWYTYYVHIRLNNSNELLTLGTLDEETPFEDTCFTSIAPCFCKDDLLKLHVLYENKNKDETTIPISVNVTGKYVFDLNNPDKDYVEIENVSLANIPDFNVSLNVSLNRPNTYTGIITSTERQENFIVLTLDTTDIKFECPFDSIKSIDLLKPISISVDEHIDTLSNPRYSYTVTEVKQM